MCIVISMLKLCVFQRNLGIYLLFIKLEQLLDQTLVQTLLGFPTLQPLTYPYPYPSKPWPLLGSRVCVGQGQGQPELTPGLPLPITIHGLPMSNTTCQWLGLRTATVLYRIDSSIVWLPYPCRLGSDQGTRWDGRRDGHQPSNTSKVPLSTGVVL